MGVGRFFHETDSVAVVGEKFAVSLRCGAFVCNKSVNLFKLRATQCRVDVRHPVVEGGAVVDKFPAVRHFCLRGKVFGFGCEPGVVEQQHASASGGNGFVAVEAHGSHKPECACVASHESGADAFGGVFDKRQPVLSAYHFYFIDSYRVSEGVHRHNRLYGFAGVLVNELACG